MLASKLMRKGPRRRLAALALVFASVTVSLAGAETVLRVIGFPPFRAGWRRPFELASGGHFVVPDPVLGYRNGPGPFQIVLPDGYSFHVTHDGNGLRLTHPPSQAHAPRPELWILGCSITHGWSLNDEQTYPWLLQQRFPGFEVVNFGVGGYGTLQSLLQFEQALKTRKTRPKLVVLAYGSFHGVRNMFLRQRQRTVVWWRSILPLIQPYARLGPNGELDVRMATRDYWEPPLIRHSALVNFLDKQYAEYEVAHSPVLDVSEKLIDRLRGEVQAAGARFVLAEITGDRQIEPWTREQRIPYVNISVPDTPDYSNRPHDMHPNAKADRMFARKLGDFLAPLLR